MVRYDICRHDYAVDRTGRRLLWSTTLLLSTLLFDSQVSISLVIHGLISLCFRTGQGPCRANLHKWGLAQSPSCDCSQRQTMNHIVDMCPLTKFEGGLNIHHEADDDAVILLESIQRLQHSRNNNSDLLDFCLRLCDIIARAIIFGDINAKMIGHWRFGADKSFSRARFSVVFASSFPFPSPVVRGIEDTFVLKLRSCWQLVVCRC